MIESGSSAAAPAPAVPRQANVEPPPPTPAFPRQFASPAASSFAAARSAPAAETQPDDQAHGEWFNETYRTTLRHVEGNEWSEFNNQTGQLHIRYELRELANDFLEVYCPERNQKVRFLDKRAELWQNGRWTWVATGHWLGNSRPFAAQSPISQRDFTSTQRTDASGGPQRSLADLIAAVEPCVIRLDVKHAQGGCIGSGFVVSPEGMAVTNYHVMDNAQSATATFSNGRTAVVVGGYCFDKDRDIAVIQLENTETYRVLPVADKLPRKGETAIALGAPIGLSFSVTEGIVSAIREADELRKMGHPEQKAGTWIQTSTQISGGNSGGPLVDQSGRVLGANTWSDPRGNDLNFATSCLDIRDMIAKSKGVASRPLAEITKTEARKHKKRTKSTGSEPRPDDADLAAERVLKELADDRDRRSDKIVALVEKIEEQKLAMKPVMLADDEPMEEIHRAEIRSLYSQIITLTTQSKQYPTLDCAHLKAGQAGKLSQTRFRAASVMSQEAGIVLAAPSNMPSSDHKFVLLYGIDATSTGEGDILAFPATNVFAAPGKVTFSFKKGVHLTVFALELVADTRDYALTAPEISEEPELTDAERIRYAKIVAGRAHKRPSMTIAPRVLSELQAQQEKQAKGKLSIAKQLSNVGKAEAARDRLKEIIAEYPETSAAQEAMELLDASGG